jgi:hypothetical protein
LAKSERLHDLRPSRNPQWQCERGDVYADTQSMVVVLQKSDGVDIAHMKEVIAKLSKQQARMQA